MVKIHEKTRGTSTRVVTAVLSPCEVQPLSRQLRNLRECQGMLQPPGAQKKIVALGNTAATLGNYVIFCGFLWDSMGLFWELLWDSMG